MPKTSLRHHTLIDLNEPAVMRSVLAQLLRRSDLAGFDRRGRPVLQIRASLPLWLLDELLVFGAEDEDLEDDDPAEGDAPVEPCLTQRHPKPLLAAR